MNARGNRKQRFGFNKRRRPQNFSNGNHNRFNDNVRKEFRHTDQLSEAEVGITEYVSNLEGFTGVIKARFSDFHVSEIDLNGQVAVLTNTDIPKERKSDIDFTTLTESPVEVLPQNIWNEIRELMKSDNKVTIKYDITDLSKDDRRSIHLKMKEIFGNKLVADTVLENDKKILNFRKPTADDNRRPTWSEDRGDYVHFIVYKEAVDTMNACYQIAEALRITPSCFTYAGIKDKRAKTTQWFCAKRVQPWKLIIKTKKIRFIKIGNITFKDTPLRLGDLSGNRFKIVLRNVTCEDSVIEKAVEHCKDHGYINYYGLQRFGNDKEVPTYAIGLQLLLGKWKEACELILKPKSSDDPELDITKAKKTYLETRDAKKSYNCLDRNKNNCVEAKLLEGLVKEEKNAFVNALSSIPRNMRLLYIHSFQSLIWNNMVSRRIKKYGPQPVENDLVVVNNVYIEPDTAAADEEEDTTEDSAEVSEPKDLERPKPSPQVKALTQSDLSNYTIFDIVLPLPGYDIQYPENMREEYKEELEKHGLTLEMPKQSVKTYTLSGAYRKIMGRAEDIQWRVMRYDDPNKSLILSDFDILRKFEQPADMKDGKYKAVILELSLDSASYATMVLREIMKTDTSPSAQIKLNDYAGSSNKTKKIASENASTEEKLETIDGNTAGSLLNDEQKLEEFKKNIFAEVVSKRKVEDDDNDELNKKLKTGDE